MDCNTERSHDDDQSPDVVPIDEPTKTAKKKKLPMAVRKQPIQLAPQRATATQNQPHTLMYINYSMQKEHNIVVVPTIIVFNEGEEEKRFQANIMMTVDATKKDVQGVIDEIILSSF